MINLHLWNEFLFIFDLWMKEIKKKKMNRHKCSGFVQNILKLNSIYRTENIAIVWNCLIICSYRTLGNEKTTISFIFVDILFCSWLNFILYNRLHSLPYAFQCWIQSYSNMNFCFFLSLFVIFVVVVYPKKKLSYYAVMKYTFLWT